MERARAWECVSSCGESAQSHLAVDAMHPLVIPESPEMAQAVVAFPEAPGQLDGHDLDGIWRIDSF